jgi:hypothetical protein
LFDYSPAPAKHRNREWRTGFALGVQATGDR